MKKLILCFISICLAVSLCACSKVSVDSTQTVELVFRYGSSSVETQLSEQDSSYIFEILDGKELYSDSPSCGFDENVSFVINGKRYCPACDKCCTVKDCSSGMYFEISRSERNTIEDIFSKYGGYFPCV